MSVLRLRAGGAVYPVHVDPGSLETVGKRVREHLDGDRMVVVADAKAGKLYGDRLRRSLSHAGWTLAGWFEVPSGERSKNLARARALYQDLLKAGVDRWTPLLALGGGVTGDLAGFVASTFLRGLPLVHVPTTVVSQVDSAIGGKTAVNFAGGKNLIGTFHQPRMVVCDPLTLETLSPRDFRAGLAEAVKIGVTLRPELFLAMENGVEALRRRDPSLLTQVVTACVEAKGEVVGRDEREQDVRAVLNYGHTIGHALESASLGRLRHGEAVAMGMNASAWVGEAMGVTLPDVRSRQNHLLEQLGLKLTAPGADKEMVLRNLKLDKKVRRSRNRFVLTLQIGGASVWPHISGRHLRDAVGLVTS